MSLSACSSNTGSEDCGAPFDPGSVSVESDDGNWRLMDGDRELIVFDTESTAERAVATIQFYDLDQKCVIGDDHQMEYWLADGQPPARTEEAPPFNEDCMEHPVDEFYVEDEGDAGLITYPQGSRMLMVSDLNEAERALNVLQENHLNEICYVGRPHAPMQYWLTSDA